MTVNALTPCRIHMPEGTYNALWSLDPDGNWAITIPGGIPAPGKAEDAHNTGLDGTYAADMTKDDRTPTIDDACREIAESITTEREQAGGYSLPFPMTVAQANQLRKWQADHG